MHVLHLASKQSCSVNVNLQGHVVFALADAAGPFHFKFKQKPPGVKKLPMEEV